MKTPKEKAKELLWKYLPILEGWKEVDSNRAKQCALIAVDEAINENGLYDRIDGYVQKRIDYLNEVKQEIEKL